MSDRRRASKREVTSRLIGSDIRSANTPPIRPNKAKAAASTGAARIGKPELARVRKASTAQSHATSARIIIGSEIKTRSGVAERPT